MIEQKNGHRAGSASAACGDEAEVLLEVVAGGERVAAGPVRVALHEAVHPAAAVLVAAAVPGVVGVAEGAALEVGRRGGRCRRSCPPRRDRRGRRCARRPSGASRSSGRRSGSPSSARRRCRSACCAGSAASPGAACAPPPRPAARATAGRPARRPPASIAVRARNSRRRSASSGCSASKRSFAAGSRRSMPSRLIARPARAAGSITVSQSMTPSSDAVDHGHVVAVAAVDLVLGCRRGRGSGRRPARRSARRRSC